MKVLVTGAGGFIGAQLVKDLIQADHEIVVLSRNPKVADEKLGLPLAGIYHWDSTQSMPPEQAFAGVNAVVHLAGESVAKGRWTTKKKKKILESRTRSTRFLVEAIEKYGSKVESFVCASAIGFYGNRPNETLNEKSARGAGFLADVCEQWEEQALSCQRARTTCLRIGMVLGREGALEKLLPLFRAGLGGPVGNGKQWMSWIHVEDVSRLIGYCLENKSVQGVLNTVAPEPVTNKKFTKSLATTLGVPALLPAPKLALRIALGQMSELATNSQKVLPHKALESGFQFLYPTIESALKAICPDPTRRCEQALIRHQWINRSVGEVFPFFSDVKNLEKITPNWLSFKVVSAPTSSVHSGQEIDYRLKVHGIPMRWKTLIEEWKPNEYFVDSQKKGPYKLWHHTHRFIPMKGGTLMVDEIRYEAPGGGFGNLFLGPLIKSDLQKIFDYRRQKVSDAYDR